MPLYGWLEILRTKKQGNVFVRELELSGHVEPMGFIGDLQSPEPVMVNVQPRPEQSGA